MNIQDKKNKIIELIDESKDDERKIAFYSDDIVQGILTRLYDEWEKNNRNGIPLDYASPEEIDTLYRLAIRYSRNPAAAYTRFIKTAYFGEKEEKNNAKDRSILHRLLRLI